MQSYCVIMYSKETTKIDLEQALHSHAGKINVLLGIIKVKHQRFV